MLQRKNKDVSKKRGEKSLPSNFFEKVFDLELQLAKEFDIATLHQLTKLFKNAIEYYESIGDPRFIDFTKRLNLLLCRNDVLKFINKDKERSKRAVSFNIKDRKKHRTNYLVNINLSETNNKVKECINQSDSLNRSRDIIIDDINKQESSFKLRLDERRSSKSPNSFIFEEKTRAYISRTESFLLNDDNISQNIEMDGNPIVSQILGTPKGFKQIFENMNDIKSITKKYTRNNNVLEYLIKNFKNQKFVNEINEKISVFLNKFNDYFNENIFKEYTITIQKLMEDKYKKYLEISNYYDNHIKEMEFLLKESEEEHKASIIEIIENLKNEMNNSTKKNEETNQILIKEAYEEFHQLGFKGNVGVKSIEKTFEGDIYKMVHIILSSN